MDMFFKERKFLDIPENISDQTRITETTDTAFFDQEQPKKRAKTKKNTRTSYQKYRLYTGKIKTQHLYQHQKCIFETTLL